MGCGAGRFRWLFGERGTGLGVMPGGLSPGGNRHRCWGKPLEVWTPQLPVSPGQTAFGIRRSAGRRGQP